MNPINVSNMNAIESQLQLYFDGLYHSDTQRLRQVFHQRVAHNRDKIGLFRLRY